MSKTNDTEKTRELNDAELAAVSGGLLNAAIAGAIAGAANGAGPTGGAVSGVRNYPPCVRVPE